MKRTMFITMLAAALLGAQGRADYIPTTITGWTHKEVSPVMSYLSYYYGKYSDTDSVSGGSVNIAADESGGDHLHHEDCVYGGYTKNGEATGNSVTMTGGTIALISGGYAEYGDAAENDVTMTGGEENKQVHGGRVLEGGNATGNTVSMSGCGLTFFVYGGAVDKGGDAIENDVSINDSVFGPCVYGGYVGEGGSATGNTVTINGGEGDSWMSHVHGGYVGEGGNADGNTVAMTESTVSAVFGGYNASETGTSKGNVVTITDSQISTAIGGMASEDASDNVVTLTGSQVSSFVRGASSGSGSAAGNSVTITDSLISGSVEGARAADASGNKVTITDSQMQLAEEGSILGGYATNGDATGNSVAITGTEFLGDHLPEVMGGHAAAGNAGGNSVDMTGGHVSSVYGGRGLASANENKVTLTDTQVTGQLMDSGGRAALVYGGASDEGDANGNSVILTGIQLGEPLGEEEQLQVSLFGFFGGSADIGEGNANGNTVTLTDEKSVDSIIVQIGGGAAFNANNNAVNIIGSGSSSLWDTQIWDVYGGYAGANNDSNANGNTVYIKDRDNIVDVYGGVGYNTANNTVVLENCDVFVVKGSESNGGKNCGNTVDITGGHVITNVYGGQGLASTNENKVNLTNAQVDDYVYGGKSDEGDAKGNVVTITDSQIEKACGGIAAGEGDASDNIVTITGSLIAGSVEGARAADASGNKVTITDSQMQLAEERSILGGYATNGDATGNSVTITGTEFLGDHLPEVMGGQADAGNAGGNSIDMTGGHVSSVYGGRGLASANENKVTLTDVQVDEYVYGGQSDEGDTTGNNVTVKNGKVASVIAGYSSKGQANDNTATVSGGQITVVQGGVSYGEGGGASGNTVDVTGIQGEWVYGAHALSGDANSNTVTVSDSKIGTTIYGGTSSLGNTSGNRVTMTGGKVFSVEGGMSNRGHSIGNTVTLSNVAASIVDGGQSYASTDGKANDNNVTVTDSQIESSVYGGNSYGEGEASGNSVTMNGGTAYNVIGGYVGKGAAIGNTVIVTGGQVTKNIAGGWLYKGGELRDNRVYLVGSGAHAVIGGQVYDGRDGGIQALAIAAGITDNAAATAPLSGNAIDVYGTGIVTGRMYGMQNLNFHIMEGLANFDEAAMVSITGTVGSDRLDLTSVQLGFYGESVEDWSAFAGKSVTLVEAAQEILGVDSGTQVDIMIGDRVVGAAALVLGSGNKTLNLENIVFVPEPATSALSLLALALLAGRRRRN